MVCWRLPTIDLTGTEAATRRIAIRYHVRYRKHAQPDVGYGPNHTTNPYLIDQAGQLFNVVPYGLPPTHVLTVVWSLLDAPAK
jgi:protein SCO1/2